MDEVFEAQRRANIARLSSDTALQQLAMDFLRETAKYEYTYNFTWLGLPIIQCPQDIVALQEIIWQVQPDLIVETGIARGGGVVFYASILELLGGGGEVVGVDVDIRPSNRAAVESHPLSDRITMIEGSSTNDDVATQVRQHAAGKSSILVILDSNHTEDHVLKELQLYSPLVTKGSYLVVCDTIIEDQPEGFFHDRPWTKTDNPKTAVRKFLRTTDRFAADRDIEGKCLITVCREGYLRCVKD